jgi:hypothetical protein
VTNTTALPCSAGLFAATRFPNWLLAGAAKGGAHPSEFALQHTREVRDDQNERTDDKAKKDDILRHRGTLFVSTQLIEELANLIHNSAPYFSSTSCSAVLSASQAACPCTNIRTSIRTGYYR